MNSKLSDKQIRAYKLCSGEHEGLPTKEAAKSMKISPQALNRLLKRAEKICPVMFPLLSVQEADVKVSLAFGHSNYDLANQLGVSISRISQIINSLYNKRPDIVAPSQPIKIVQYAPHMDSQIKERF